MPNDVTSERGAQAHAELAARQRGQDRAKRLEIPSGRADREALDQQIEETGGADGDQRIRARPAVGRPDGERGARDEQGAERREPPLAVQEDLQQRRRRFLRRDVRDPAQCEHAALQRVPRDEQEACRADGEPEEHRSARVGHRGACAISFSQRSSRRFLVSLEPYFAKS